MDACYPFLPALLRSPFRLRDKLTNSVFGPPSKALLLSGVESGRHAANKPLEISKYIMDAITGRLQVPCG